MPRSVKHGGKKVYRFRNVKNTVGAKKKAAKKKRHAQVHCKEIAAEWDHSKTTKQNLAEMGLSYDVNKALPLKRGIRYGIDKADAEEMDLSEARSAGTVEDQRKRLAEKEKELLKKRTTVKQAAAAKKKSAKVPATIVEPTPEKSKSERVHEALEEAAATETTLAKGRGPRLLERDVEFCIYMLEKHGEDYEAMARDRRNIFQDTPKQLARKIRVYKQSPYFKIINQGDAMEQ